MYHLVSVNKKTWVADSSKEDLRMLGEGGVLTSKSGGAKTIKELIEKQKILKDPCVHCNSIIGTNYTEPTKTELIRDNICFFCHFWLGYIKKKDDPKIARIDGSHYYIESDNPEAYFKGFGGREFKIKFNNVQIIIAHNLWHQGTSPEHFREQLPDNTVFI